MLENFRIFAFKHFFPIVFILYLHLIFFPYKTGYTNMFSRFLHFQVAFYLE